MCLNVLRKAAFPSKPSGRVDVRHAGVVAESAKRETWWDDKKVSRLEGDNFIIGKRLGNSSFYFCGPFGSQWASFLFYLPLRVPSMDTVVVFEVVCEVDFFSSKTHALELAPPNLGQNSVVSGTAQFSPAFLGPERSPQL